LGGGVWLADGAELLLMSSVTRAVASEWHLQGFVQSMVITFVFFGIFVGNFVSGPLSSRFGRREMIVASYSGMFVFGILSSFSQHVVELTIIRFFVGMSIGLGQPAWLAISSEITPPTWRIAMSSAAQSLFVLGEVYTAFLIMNDDPSLQALNWRGLMRCTAMPSFVLATLSMSFLNESPMYLAAKGDHAEARRVLLSMRSQNCGATSQLDISYRPPIQASLLGSESFLSKFRRQLKVVFSKSMLSPSLVIMYSCFTLNMAYYGSLYSFPQVLPSLVEHGAASELIVGALWELPGLALGVVLGFIATRKTGLKCYLALFASFIVLFIIGANNLKSHGFMRTVTFLGYYGIKFTPNIGFVMIYQISAEAYPTEARTTGSALCLAAGRLASMSAPMIYELLHSLTRSFMLFFLMMAGMSLVNLYLVDIIPETGDKLLEEEEQEETSGQQDDENPAAAVNKTA